ncbi:MAG: hypothetical protein JWR10_3337 [Rubritepida sp.]|nr:hypothetical protein [Rubritepida sp.]
MSSTSDNAGRIANDAKDDANRFVSGAKADADRFVSDAKDEIMQLREKVEALMTDRVTPALTAVASRAEAMTKNATDEVRYQAERVTEKVQERPLMALGVAALAGFVLASVLRR